MPNRFCKRVAERLRSVKVRKPACVVAQILIKQIFKVVGFNNVAQSFIFVFVNQAVFKSVKRIFSPVFSASVFDLKGTGVYCDMSEMQLFPSAFFSAIQAQELCHQFFQVKQDVLL